MHNSARRRAGRVVEARQAFLASVRQAELQFHEFETKLHSVSPDEFREMIADITDSFRPTQKASTHSIVHCIDQFQVSCFRPAQRPRSPMITS